MTLVRTHFSLYSPYLISLSLSLAGSMVWVDPATNANVVYNPGDLAWVIAATALVWLMIPGVGYFYSGLLRRKNALSMIYLSMMCVAVVSFQVRLLLPYFFHSSSYPFLLQWFFWGFSLTFSETGSAYIGNLKYFGLKGVLERPSMGSTRIPSIAFCVFQLMFAAITCAPP
jgi:ammonium transporter, Amt family